MVQVVQGAGAVFRPAPILANSPPHMFLWHNDTMSAKPVQVSIDLDLLHRIDADPETLARGRSAFIRSAVSSYLRAKRQREIDSAIDAAYAGNADAMRAEVSDLLDAQAWPDD